MKRYRKAEISVAVGLITAILFSIFGFSANCAEVRDNVIRLHIIANSDSEDDQQIKLLVRDALLESGSEMFSGTVKLDDAQKTLETEKDLIISVAKNVLRENGFEYDVSVSMEKEYFATRAYENFTMPAGEYLALKVIIGNGEGKNWWCVMFPPLCLPAAGEDVDIDAVLGKDGTKLISTNSKYEMRFKIVEIYERIKMKYSKFNN
jgi:stage II sporulation protein R